MAIKILDKGKLEPRTQKLLSREIEAMEKLHHPNILRYLVFTWARGLGIVGPLASAKGEGDIQWLVLCCGSSSAKGGKVIFSD